MGRVKWIVLFAVATLLISSYNMKTPSFAQTTPTITTPSSINAPPAGALVVPDNYQTIQAAIGNASNGDTVFVKDGTYNYSAYFYLDGIIIYKSLSLVGEDSQKTIIQPLFNGGPYPARSAITVTADNVTISGFTIDGAVYNTPGITFSNGSTLSAQSFPFMGNGIFVGGTNCRVIGNNIVNFIIAGVKCGAENSLISQNNITDIISGNRIDTGIIVLSSDSIISNNNITGIGSIGISVGSSKNVSIYQNNIVGNGFSKSTTVVNALGGLSLSSNGSCNIYENNIEGNFGFGIEFAQSSNALIHNNNIIQNGFGINLVNYEFASRNVTGGLGNKVYYNNIIENSKNAFVQHSYEFNVTPNNNGTDIVSWDNGAVGNYWNDYHGKGAYVIDQDNIDHYPLTQQVNISNSAPVAGISMIIISIFAVVVVLIVLVVSLLFYRAHRKTS